MTEEELTYKELFTLHGEDVEYDIEDVKGKGKICIEASEAYICQNDKDGQQAKNKLGFKYSWVLSSHSYRYCITALPGRTNYPIF